MDVLVHTDSLGSYFKNICISSKNGPYSNGVSSRFVKLPWDLFLSANNALTKNFLFNSHPDFIFCGLFVCPWSLKRPKKCLRLRFRTH